MEYVQFTESRIRMMGNSVLVESLPQVQKSAGGVHLPQQYRDDQTQWRVLAVGPGRKNKKGVLVAPEVKPGDRVLAPLYHDHVILSGPFKGQRIIDASAIIAVITPA